MWALYYENGKLFREGYPSQWEAVRVAQRADGSSFKKAEALVLPSGTEVFRRHESIHQIAVPCVHKNGKRDEDYVKKVPSIKNVRLILQQV